MSKVKKKKNEEGKKKNEYRKKVRRRRGTSPAAGVYLPEGRLPSTFGVPCSSFDIPAEGGSFLKRSLEKSLGSNCQGRGGVPPPDFTEILEYIHKFKNQLNCYGFYD
jgi:hypothetical protein